MNQPPPGTIWSPPGPWRVGAFCEDVPTSRVYALTCKNGLDAPPVWEYVGQSG